MTARLPETQRLQRSRSRDLSWHGCNNVRDLGGHPSENGGEARFGAIVRADSVRRLSDAGWEALVAYGSRTIVDLRWDSELEADPPREVPVDVVHISLLGEPERAVTSRPSSRSGSPRRRTKGTGGVAVA